MKGNHVDFVGTPGRRSDGDNVHEKNGGASEPESHGYTITLSFTGILPVWVAGGWEKSNLANCFGMFQFLPWVSEEQAQFVLSLVTFRPLYVVSL